MICDGPNLAPLWGDTCESCDSTGKLCKECRFCEGCGHKRGCDCTERVGRDEHDRPQPGT